MSAELRACVGTVASALNAGIIPESFRGFEEDLCEGAVRGLDIKQFSSIAEWVQWLSFASITLDESDYLKAAIYGLNLATKLAGTDYGTSRQRDLGQLWTDTIRGLLGEIAFAKWLENRFDVHIELDYRLGPLEEFLPSDIKKVNGREPRLKVSIKTTKLGGIWLDLPGAQIKHSDVFVLVRVGATREHFIAFLKKISVIKNKLLEEALSRGLISDELAKTVWNAVPEFKHIPAYIAGFLDKSEYGAKLNDERCIIEADGEVKTRRIIINKFLGYWKPGAPEYEEALRSLLKSKGKRAENMKLEFEGIREFSRSLHFIASSGVLKKKREDWESLVKRL